MQPPFRPAQDEPCFCGSGTSFGDCCGSFTGKSGLPFGVHILPDFLNQNICQKLIRYLESQPRKRMKVVDELRSTKEHIVQRPDENRICEEVHCGNVRSQVDMLTRRAWNAIIRPEVHRRFSWYEQPVMLRYSEGGQYRTHADSDYYDANRDTWFKCMDRDMSLLIYLNDSFTGGELYLSNFEFTYVPHAGDLVFFPSDHRYMHEARLVTSGLRYTIVSWAAFRNQQRVMDVPQGIQIAL